MPGPGEQPEEESRLGDYELVALLAEGPRTRTYRAAQISIDRAVVLERLTPGTEAEPGVAERFLADVRAKAAVDHPGIGSVYEAVDDGEAVYYAREFLPGRNFEELREARASFLPSAVASFLRQVGTAMEHLELSGAAKVPLEARHLFLGDHHVVRLANLAMAEPEAAAVSGRDRLLVAELLLGLLVRGAPGATRVSTLLNMMAGQGGTALSWGQVALAARKLEQDLSEGAGVASQLIKSGPIAEGPVRSRVMTGLLILVIVLSVVAAIAVGALLRNNRKAAPRARALEAMVEIPAGRFPTHDGKMVELKRFWIDAHEVSIGEYAAFLDVLAGLPAEKRGGYDHADQPSLKLDHIPDDWEAMLTAARSGGTVGDLRFDLNHPVVQVDWWDAHAYANWKGGRLPTQEEWFASAQDGEVSPAERGAVDRLPEDVTPRGIFGLAGNVSEWMRDPGINPAFPMNPKQPLCCGGSFLHPRNGVRTRTWLPSRETRRIDVGFRTVREAAP